VTAANATGVLGSDTVAWARRVSRQTVTEVLAREPAYIDLPYDAIHRLSESLLIQVLARLAGQEIAVDASSSYGEIAASAAEQGVPFDQVIRSMRSAQALWLEHLIGRSLPGSESDHRRVAMVVSAVMDDAITRIVAAYVAARDRLAEGEAASRRALIEAVLRRADVDPDVVHREVGVSLGQHHIGAVLWRPGGATSAQLARIARQLADTLVGSTLLTLTASDGRLWGWLSRARPASAREMDAVAGLVPRVRDVRVALGAPGSGGEGFRRSHLQALDAARLAERDARAPAVVTWSSVSLVSLLAADLERASWFVEATLGPLAWSDPAAAEQRATLLRYLQTGGSVARTAEDRRVHRNTVVYRLRRIEESLPLALAEHRAEVHAALMLAERCGEQVLGQR
jgi:DNA-binding PucR family transcriptional regulator